MAFSLSTVGAGFVSWIRFLFSKKGIPTWKGTLAYVIAYILAFINPFTDLIAAPPQVSGLMIIVVLAVVGLPVGLFIDGMIWIIFGIMLGALCAYILANLAGVLVAQGVVYFLLVYIFSFAKAVSLKYLAFTLLGIVWCVTGVASSIGNNQQPNIPVIVGTIQAYFWGVAIVFFVNFFVFPVSCETILRSTMVSALQHMDTLSRLVLQAYSGGLTESEESLRKELMGTLRKEMDTMNQMLGGTFFEINWSKWSLNNLTHQTKVAHQLHETLMSICADYASAEKAGCILEIRARFLQNNVADMKQLCTAISITVADILATLDPAASHKPETVRNAVDLEREDITAARDRISPASEDVVRAFRQRFAEEMEAHDSARTAASSATYVPVTDGDSGTKAIPTANVPTAIRALHLYMDRWAAPQLDAVGSLLVSGGFDGKDRPLTLEAPLASIADMFSRDYISDIAGAGESLPYTPKLGSKAVSVDSIEGEKEEYELSIGETSTNKLSEALVRMYSLLFAMHRFTAELQELHEAIVSNFKSKTRGRPHVHWYQHFCSRAPIRSHAATVPLTEAAQAIGAQAANRKHHGLWDYFLLAERYLRGPRNVYAFKLTLAIEILTILVWAPVTRPWFLSYGLPITVVTVVLLVTPTFGETWMWTAQQLGGVLGYITALILLEIFRNVGGYAYNPYGIVCITAVWTIPLMYLMHEVPIGFPFGLLALVFGAIYMCNNYVNEVTLGAPYDSAALAAGKALTTIAVGIALGVIFQYLILRNPARRTLRKAIVELLHTNRQYLSLLHAYFRAVQTPVTGANVPSAAYNAIENELERREAVIRGQMAVIAPMVGNLFGEPHWDAPFGGEAAVKVLEANEILLDRLKDALKSTRSHTYPLPLLKHFIHPLAPYRRQWAVTTRTSLYLSAAALSAQTPLPRDMVRWPWRFLRDMMGDAVVLGARMGRTEEGRGVMKGRDFARFWFFLLAMSAATEQIQAIEEACGSVYGTDEAI